MLMTLFTDICIFAFICTDLSNNCTLLLARLILANQIDQCNALVQTHDNVMRRFLNYFVPKVINKLLLSLMH